MTSTPPVAGLPLRGRAARRIGIRNLDVALLVPAEATGGAYSVLELTLAPGFVAMPLHTHARETETAYVLEGALTVQVGDDTTTLLAGDSAVRPPGVPHTFWNVGGRPVRFLEIVAPGGIEAYYEALEPLIPASGSPAMAEIHALSARFGLTFEMESLLDIIHRYSVRLA